MLTLLPPNPRRAGQTAWEILQSPSAIERCANRSYIHPNGFAKVTLSSDQTGSIRLHYWDGSARQDDVHSHRWDFTSIVLAGLFHEVLYSVTEGGDAVRYRCTRDGLDSQLLEPVPVALTPDSDYELSTGDRIARRAGVFHRLSCIGSRRGMTLVRTDRPRHEHSYVVRTSRDGGQVSKATRLSPEQLRAILEEFLTIEG